ncbi:MAG: hypothetical protein LBH02_02420 [Methanocalculaceae archaeon]|jgi:hypothetical protein|nr:hypothetical protein [Methanocalculaceae archaeon]
MRVIGAIVSIHAHPEHVVSALSPDSNEFMTVEVIDGRITAKIESESLRSMIATVDDYLMNLSISERLC